MSTVTVSRQMGSLGTDIARQVGLHLGYQVIGRELINKAACRAGCPEVALATIDELGLLGLRPSRTAQLAYHKAVRHVLAERADAGQVIIIGRAGQVILKGRPDVLHVRVIAPKELRAERIARSHDITIQAALARVEASDHARREYLRRHYGAYWDDPELYNLVINTARTESETAAEIIRLCLERCWRPQPNDHQSR